MSKEILVYAVLVVIGVGLTVYAYMINHNTVTQILNSVDGRCYDINGEETLNISNTDIAVLFVRHGDVTVESLYDGKVKVLSRDTEVALNPGNWKITGSATVCYIRSTV